MKDVATRLARARLSLEGLSIGDGFGEQFFYPHTAPESIGSKTLPPPPWRYTDDTEMAIGIYEVLRRHCGIEQDELAHCFAERYAVNPRRGYGGGAARLLRAIAEGGDWRELSPAAFGGKGSLGNGAAMRVAPLGAYFAEDLAQVLEQARASAEVTHYHSEGIAGAIAVAVAAAWVWQWQFAGRTANAAELLRVAAEYTPLGATRDGIVAAQSIPLNEWEFTAANTLGDGSRITAPDTVPFCLWCAAAHLDDFAEALWTAVRVGGDRDTNAATVGGIVALAVGEDGIPNEWRAAREPLDVR